jgi:histone H3/H4
MSFIVKSKVQEFAKSKDLQVSSEFYGALDAKVKDILEHAGKRTEGNKRKTLKEYDL